MVIHNEDDCEVLEDCIDGYAQKLLDGHVRDHWLDSKIKIPTRLFDPV